MRFYSGPFPENPIFNPEAEGWFAVPETENLQAVYRKAKRASLVLFLFWLPLYLFALPLELFVPQVIHLSSNVFRIQYPILQLPLWLVLTILILFIPTHEIIHALCCPQLGLSAKTVFGLWFQKGFFYVHHEGPMSRNHLLLVLVAPYIVLSLLPLAAIGVFKVLDWTPELLISLAWLSLLGSIFAGGDFVSIGLLLSHIPSAAIVRNKGRRSYWKPTGKISPTV